MVHFCLPGVLRHNQIDSPIMVIIRNRAPALFAVNFDPAFLAGNGGEASLAVTFEPKTSSAVVGRITGFSGKEVLAKENVLVTVAVHVRNTNSESRGHLRFNRENMSLEMVASI